MLLGEYVSTTRTRCVSYSESASNLLVNVLQVDKSVWDILRVSDIILCNLKVAACTLEDAVDEISQCRRVFCPVLLQPFLCDMI